MRACESDGQVILLDLMRNRYLGIGRPASAALAALVQGWPASPGPNEPGSAAAPIGDLARRLISQGLLTDAASVQLPPPAPEEAISSLDAEGPFTRETVGARRVIRFLRSAAITAWWLRRHSLHAIALKVAARRQRLAPPAAQAMDTIRSAAAAYETLRPLVFTARERCLHDSLALVSFLAAEGLHARWVIGVRTSPFGAHSWAQSAGVVLNDQHEYVRSFRPILIV